MPLNLNRTGIPLDRDERNATNANWAAIEGETARLDTQVAQVNTTANNAVTTAANAVTTANQAKTQAQAAEDKADDMQQQLDNIIIESGTSDAEVIQARGDFDILNDRLDATDTSLAEKANQIVKAKELKEATATVRKRKPLVTFTDDDGHPNVMTRLKPLAEKYNIPFTLCVPSDWIKNGTSGVTKQQLLDLQNELGFEIASHGKTHDAINDATMAKEQQFVEVAQSWSDMTDMGFNVDTIIYPYGQITEYGKQIVSQYYTAGVSTDARLNGTPSKTLLLGRIKFPGDGAAQQTLAYYKSKVDEAVANNSWLIFMMHVGFVEHTPAQQEILDELIAYIQSINVDIVNVRDAMKTVGNALSVNEEQYYIGNDGTTNLKDYMYEKPNTQTGASAYTLATLPNSFPMGKVVTNTVPSTDSPSGARGLLVTYVRENTNQDTYQVFLSSRRSYERYSNPDNTWTSWLRVFKGETLETSPTAGTVPAGGFLTKNLTVPGFATTWNYTVTPLFEVPNGLFYSVSYYGGGVIKLSFFNATTSNIAINATDLWRVFYMR